MTDTYYGKSVLETKRSVCSLEVSLVLSLFKYATDKGFEPDVDETLLESALACFFNASILLSDLVLVTAKEQDTTKDTNATVEVDVSGFPAEILGTALILSMRIPTFNIELDDENKKVTCSFTDAEEVPDGMDDVVYNIECLRHGVFTSGLLDLVRSGAMLLQKLTSGYSKPVDGVAPIVCCEAGFLEILSSLLYDILAGISFGAEYVASEKLSPDKLDLLEYAFNSFDCFNAEVRDSEEDPERRVFSVEFTMVDETKGDFNKLLKEKMDTVEFNELAKGFLTNSKYVND